MRKDLKISPEKARFIQADLNKILFYVIILQQKNT